MKLADALSFDPNELEEDLLRNLKEVSTQISFLLENEESREMLSDQAVNDYKNLLHIVNEMITKLSEKYE